MAARRRGVWNRRQPELSIETFSYSDVNYTALEPVSSQVRCEQMNERGDEELLLSQHHPVPFIDPCAPDAIGNTIPPLDDQSPQQILQCSSRGPDDDKIGDNVIHL